MLLKQKTLQSVWFVVNIKVLIISTMKRIRSEWQQASKSAKLQIFFWILILGASVVFVLGTFWGKIAPLEGVGRLLTLKNGTTAELKTKLAAQRKSFLASKSTLQGLQFAESNLNIRKYSTNILDLKEYQRLNEQLRFEYHQSELPFCIIVQALDFTDRVSYQFTLNSIFNQNYTNFKAIIVHNADKKQQFQMVGQYLANSSISGRLYTNVLNLSPKSMLKNLYDATHQYCSLDSISLNIVRNQELLGRNVLKTFNALYQMNTVSLIYSNFYRYNEGSYVKVGWNFAFPEHILRNARKEKAMIFAAATYRTNFFLDIPQQEYHIPEADLGPRGSSLDVVFEQSLYFPLIQRMCGSILQVEGFSMIVKENYRNYSDFLEAIRKQRPFSLQVRNKPVLSCNEGYLGYSHSTPIITSFSKKHLLDFPQLSQISTETRQQIGELSVPLKGAVFTVPPKSIETRDADRYIYSGKISVAEQKRNFEIVRLDFVDSPTTPPINILLKQNLYLQDSTGENEYDKLINDEERKIQIPFCLVISELQSNNQEYRFEYLLNSIFKQYYSNYFVVINNHNPMFDKYVRKYLHQYQIRKDLYVYHERSHLSTPLEAVYNSINEYCNPRSYVLVLNGLNELTTKYALNHINIAIQQRNLQIVYGNIIMFNQYARSSFIVQTQDYTDEQKNKNLYREIKVKFSHLVAFKAKLFRQIEKKYLQDQKGNFYSSNMHGLISYPLFQLSCGNNAKIAGAFLLTNSDLPPAPFNPDFHKEITTWKKYQCKQNNAMLIQNEKLQLAKFSEVKVQSSSLVFASPKKSLDLLAFNKYGDTIQEYLYRLDAGTIASRRQYQRQRESAADLIGDKLPKLNLKLDNTKNKEDQELIIKQYAEIRQNFPTEPKYEDTVCVVIDLNFQVPFEFEYTLNSVFSQNYTNYFAVIFGDGSDKGDLLIRRYLNFYPIPHESFVYLPNKNGIRGIQNILIAAQSHCSKESLLIYLKHSDELIGKNALKLLSWSQKELNAEIIYSDAYLEEESQIIPQNVNIKVQEVTAGLYRTENYKLPSNPAISVALLHKVEVSNFKKANQKYFQIQTNRALLAPLLQVACKKTVKVSGVRFLVRSLSKITVNTTIQTEELMAIKSKASYKCQIQN